MGFSNTATGHSYNHYGVRETGGAVGIEHNYGSLWTVKIDLTGQSIADAIAGYVPPFYLKKGMLLKSAVLRVDEVFVVTGTTPHLEIGSAGSQATDGLTITEAQLEALGSTDISAACIGTWATNGTGLATDDLVQMSLEGDSVIATTSGKATVILEFVYNTKI